MTKTALQWLTLIAGVVIAYSAIRNKSPQDLLYDHFGVGLPKGKGAGTVTGPVASINAPATAQLAGTAYVFDRNGNNIGVLPNAYTATPALYIPTVPR